MLDGYLLGAGWSLQPLEALMLLSIPGEMRIVILLADAESALGAEHVVKMLPQLQANLAPTLHRWKREKTAEEDCELLGCSSARLVGQTVRDSMNAPELDDEDGKDEASRKKRCRGGRIWAQ